MIQPAGHHLAEFNLGTLAHHWDDPRVAEFTDNLSRVSALAQRAPGFVWQMPGEEMQAAQTDPDGPLGGDPRTASTLSVWQDGESLDRFVWGTVHKRFFDKRAAWFLPPQGEGLVLWWVPVGHRPSLAEAAARLRHLNARGDSDRAFGWAALPDARLWRARACGELASE